MIDLKGKIALVTGATNGIGKETARALATMGATVIIVGRNPQKTEAVVEELRNTTGSPTLHKAIADLSRQADVRELASQFKATYDALHILVNNAGALFDKRQESDDGIELTLALNHLNYFLLTHELRDLLVASAPARVINVASQAQGGARLILDDLERKTSYNGFGAYAQSKLLNILFTFALARRLEGTGVVTHAMHPGFVGTGFASNNGGAMKLVMGLIKPLILTPQQGADTAIWLATDPSVASQTGGYWEKRKPIRAQSVAYDVAAQERLWQISERMTGINVTA